MDDKRCIAATIADIQGLGQDGGVSEPEDSDDPTDDVAAMMRVARIVFAVVVRSVGHADNGLTMPQLRALVLVASSSTEVTTSSVAAALDVDLSTASRMCGRLVNAGWLDRRESPQDRRNLLLSLTPEGSAVLATVMTHRRAAFTTILAQLPAEDRAAVRRSFDTFAYAAGVEATSLDYLTSPG